MAILDSKSDLPLNRSLRIGVDVRGLEIESSLRRGIGRYVSNLLRAMAALCPNHQFRLYGDQVPWQVPHLAALQEHANVRYVTYHPAFTSDVDVLLLTDPAPVLEGRALLPHPLNGLPCATIFYDLIPLAFREEYLDSNPRLRDEYLRRLEELKQTAGLFLTISRFVADDLGTRLGVPRERIEAVMGGLDDVFAVPPAASEVTAVLNRLGVSTPYFFYTGGADYRKNLVALLLAFGEVRASSRRPVKLVLAGEFGDEWREAVAAQPEFTAMMGDVVTPGYVSDDDLRCLYAGATAFVFPSLYEGFGLPALEAMASGSPVIAADGSSLKEIVQDAGLLVDPLRPRAIADAMRRLLGDPMLAATLRSKGLSHAQQFRWEDVARQTLGALARIANPARSLSAPVRRMKVVIQNRPDALDAPGGDTVVMERLFKSLRALDVEVDAASGSPDLSGVDMVHLLNLTVASTGREVAENCARSSVPFMVTALFEDWPLYLDRSFEAARLFADYQRNGGDRAKFREGLERLRALPTTGAPDHGELASRAAGLFACGESEAARLVAAYPDIANRVHIARFGIDTSTTVRDVEKRMILKAVGFDRFLLCCGRLETRKNQLMLLKALEDSDLPVVFASGGFSYQPQYVQLVSNFRRRGPVRVIGRVGAQSLRTLMSAAAVHALPSWYELPGLVTLEAASAGAAVVASDWGAIRDYLSEGAHFCQPDDPDSIREAVEAALAAGPDPRARAVADSYTWDAFGEATLRAYEQVLTRHRAPAAVTVAVHQSQSDTQRYHSMEQPMSLSNRKSPRFDASIIIPVHNRARLTQECLEALSNARTDATYELIIVDNASSDDTPRLLQAVEGDVTILRQSVNRGFAEGCNLGARMANGEFLVFLNNDTKPLDGWLDELVRCARTEKSVGAVGSRLLYPEGKVQHAGVAVNVNKIPYHVFQNFGSEHPAVNEQRDMQAVTGACMLIPTNLFNQLGGFDEDYRNGFEDIDLCMRIRAAQHRVIYCPLSTVIHHEEASEGRKTFDRENLERFMSRWESELRSDETELLARHGYRITWSTGHGTYEELPAMPVPAPVTIELAQQLYSDGQLEEAAVALQALVESRMVLGREDSFETYQTLGNCLARLNRVEEAEKAYCEAIKLDEASDRPYLGLGALAMLQENWQAAMYGFMTALAKNPGTIRGEFGVALSMAVRNMHADALEHFRRVLAHDAYNAEALFYFYRSAVESAQPQIAIEPLQRYLERYPRDTNFLFSLCGAYWKCGELAQATELCQRVLELDSDHVAAREVLDHLKASVAEYA